MWVLIVLGVLIILGIVISISVSVYSNDKATPRTSYDELEAKQFGKAGENYVAKYLSGIVSSYGGYLYNDFCFEDEEGFSTEIDHIVITRGGVFIIETKTLKGTIYGGKDDEWWKCIKKRYQDDKSFRNPILQNQGHINHLRRMFKSNPPKMISMIIFPVANIANVGSDIVYNLNGALTAIRDLTAANKYSAAYVEKINDQIKYIRDNYSITKEKHIQNIRKMYH